MAKFCVVSLMLAVVVALALGQAKARNVPGDQTATATVATTNPESGNAVGVEDEKNGILYGGLGGGVGAAVLGVPVLLGGAGGAAAGVGGGLGGVGAGLGGIGALGGGIGGVGGGLGSVGGVAGLGGVGGLGLGGLGGLGGGGMGGGVGGGAGLGGGFGHHLP